MTEHRLPYEAFSTDAQMFPLQQDIRVVEQAKAIVLAAHFLYHIRVTYRALPDGTYEVLPVGDNDFTTIASAAYLSDAILGQITAFMESPAFIAQQVTRLTAK